MKREDLAYYFSVIMAAANAGMEIDETDELIMIFTEAEIYLIDNRPNGVEYIQTDLDTDGKNQSYIFVDECGHGDALQRRDFRLRKQIHERGQTAVPLGWQRRLHTMFLVRHPIPRRGGTEGVCICLRHRNPPERKSGDAV